MSSSAPVAFSNNQRIPPTAEQPAQGPPPQVSFMDMECDPQPTPRELHEEQMQFMAQVFDKEISSHNKTRERLLRYLHMYMKQERDSCAALVHTQYLGAVINNLRTQLNQEQVRTKALEQEKARLLEESFNNLTCDYPVDTQQNNINGDISDPLLLGGAAESKQIQAALGKNDGHAAGSADFHSLKQLFCLEQKDGNSQIHPTGLRIIPWTPSGRSSPERFALDDDELSDHAEESTGDKRKESASRSNAEERESKFAKY